MTQKSPSHDEFTMTIGQSEFSEKNAHLFAAEERSKDWPKYFSVAAMSRLTPVEGAPVAEALPRPLNVEERYRALVEQIPAVVFMAYLDQGIGEAYVSPQIEASLGIFAARVAGRSDALVSTDSSGRQAAVER